MPGHRIFVSYSREDAAFVQPVVKLLRVAPAFVFLDSDSIQPGQQWRTVLEQAISDANLVLVFWCRHSGQSPEVAREYQAALGAAKDIVPVLLDATPLPKPLTEYQWIDFRTIAGMTHDGQAPAPYIAEAASPRRSAPAAPSLKGVSASVVIATLLAMSAWLLNSWLVLFAGTALVVMYAIMRRARNWAGNQTATGQTPAGARPSEEMARVLLAEIVRRSDYESAKPFERSKT